MIRLDADFSEESFAFESEQDEQLVEQAIVQTLIRACDDFVTRARAKTKEEGGFGNKTGNLRSSIAGIVLQDGEIIHSNFEKSSLGTDGTKGLEAAQQYAEELANENNIGLCLIAIAGEDYALSVEAKGLDVITGTGLLIEAELKGSLDNAA